MALAQRLKDVVGLDDETISSQIVPHVSALSTREEVVDYLVTLLGAEESGFVNHYADSRFGKQDVKAWTGTSSSRAHERQPPTRPNQRDRAASKKQQQQQQASSSRSNNWKPSVPLNAAQRAANARQQKPEEIHLSIDASADIEELERQLSSLDINLRPRLGTPCFCAATMHSLSPLAPLCTSCALVHCHLNSPLACAACRKPLMSNAAREDLVSSIQQRRKQIIEAEVDRLRVEQAQRDGVAFPQLSTSSHFLSEVPSHMRTGPKGLGPNAIAAAAAKQSWASKTGRSLPAAEELARKIEEAYTFDPSSASAPSSSKDEATDPKFARTITIGSNGKVTKVQTRRPAPRHYNQPRRGSSTDKALADGDQVDLMALAKSNEGPGWIDENDDFVIESAKNRHAQVKSERDPNRPFLDTNRRLVEYQAV